MATPDKPSPPAVRTIARESLTSKVYGELRAGLTEGRFWPGYRFKIRELAVAMKVSETPCREALMQLVRERALDMDAGRSLKAASLTLAQYLELRTVRLELEGMAAEAATLHITSAQLAQVEKLHKALIKAETLGDWPAAVRTNWLFHRAIYAAAQMPELLGLIEGIWLRNGPMLNLLYPDAAPRYDGHHQHLAVIDGLRRCQPAQVRAAIQADMVEGGRGLVALLERIDRGEIDLPVRAALPVAPAPAGRKKKSAPAQR